MLRKINEGPPPEWQAVFTKSIEKRRNDRWSDAEQKQLLKLVEQMERYDVKRMMWLTERAAIRKLPVRAVIQSLGLKTPD